MYNAQMKEEFLGTISNDNSYKSFVRIFSATEDVEERFGKDICQMSVDEILSVMDLKTGTRKHNTMQFISLMRIYVDWCIHNGKTRSENNFEKISATDADKSRIFRIKYIKDAAEFEEMCRVVYKQDAFYNESVDKQKELCIRLVFAGMENEEITHMEKSHIDYDNEIIRSPFYEGISYKVDRHILDLCDYCINQEEAAYTGNNQRIERYCNNKYVIRPRISALRGKSEADPMNPISILRRMKEFCEKYYEETEIYKDIPVTKLRESGTFITIHKQDDPITYIKTVIREDIITRKPDIKKRNLDNAVIKTIDLYQSWVKAFYE